jgi:lysozyme family protein
VFDDGVLQGQPTATKSLQNALGIKADGIIGPNTIKAFENKDNNVVKSNFIKNVHNIEDKYLQNNPNQRVFEKGHRDRFNRY